MKKGFVIGLLFVVTRLSAAVTPAPKIGYGSSLAVTSAERQELFYRGFEAGFERALGPRAAKRDLEVVQSSNGSPLGALESARELVDDGAVALVGFPSSHEALLAAKVAKEKNLFALFAGASHSDLAKMGPHIFTIGESMGLSVEAMLAFLSSHSIGKRGAVIVNPFAVFSKDQQTIFHEMASRPEYRSLHLEYFSLDKDRRLSPESLKALKSGHFDFMCLTAYAEELTAFMAQMEHEHVDLTLVTPSAWLTGNYEEIRGYLLNKKHPIYSGTLWLPGCSTSRAIETYLRQKYSSAPTSEMMFGYDTGWVMGQLRRRIKGKLSAESLHQALLAHPCFDHTSSGSLCFPPSGGHANRSITYVRLTKLGPQTVEKEPRSFRRRQ